MLFRDMPIKYLPLPLIACFATFAFGGLFIPGEWYAALNKAPWSPPNIAFPIVWAILYVFIALSGWQVLSSDKQSLKQLWGTQLVVNAVWSWAFFGQHWVTFGLIIILILICLITVLICLSVKKKLIMTAYLSLPYLAWLLLAASLNGYILINN